MHSSFYPSAGVDAEFSTHNVAIKSFTALFSRFMGKAWQSSQMENEQSSGLLAVLWFSQDDNWSNNQTIAFG